MATCAGLLLARASGFWGFLARTPSALDGTSVRLLITHAVWPLALAGLAWACAAALGRRVLRAAGMGEDDAPVAPALGLGLLGQTAFLIGWTWGIRPAALAVCAAGAAALLVSPRPLAPRPPRPEGALAGAAAGLLAFALAAALLDALAPPAGWDVRAYHLAIPERYLQAGRVVPLPWLLHSHWPHVMEVLYALPLAAGRDGAAALLHLGAAVLLVASASASARRASGPAAGWTCALLLAAQPALRLNAGTAHADAACALFAFASCTALARWEREGKDAPLLVAGTLAGFCAATKMTGLAVVAGGAAAAAWSSKRPRAPVLFLAAAVPAVGPWLLKAWLEAGSPFWPFAATDPAGAALAERYLASNRWTFPPPAWMLGHDAPLMLLAPVLLLSALRPRPRESPPREVLFLAAAAPFFLLLSFRHHEAWRFLMPVWAALAVDAGRRAAELLSAGGARAAAAAVLVAAGSVPIVLASPNNALFAVLAPRPSSGAPDRRAAWEERAVDVAGFHREARAALPPGSRVLLFREVRGYGAGFDYVWGDPMNQALVDYRALPGPDALLRRLRELGITHVLDHPGSTLYREDPGYYDRRTLALMAEALRRGARPVLARDGLVLHELAPE